MSNWGQLCVLCPKTISLMRADTAGHTYPGSLSISQTSKPTSCTRCQIIPDPRDSSENRDLLMMKKAMFSCTKNALAFSMPLRSGLTFHPACFTFPGTVVIVPLRHIPRPSLLFQARPGALWYHDLHNKVPPLLNICHTNCRKNTIWYNMDEFHCWVIFWWHYKLYGCQTLLVNHLYIFTHYPSLINTTLSELNLHYNMFLVWNCY